MKLFGAKAKKTPGYREWWDNASKSMADAYASTIGPMTEEQYRVRGWHGDPNSFGAKQFIDRARLDSQSRVLEIGCGIARIGREMAPHVLEWHGADVSPNMLAHARERCAHLSNVKLHELAMPNGLEALPAGYYDFVYATVVLMHLDKEDLFNYLKQSHRMLKTGGRAFFDTWNILHPDTFRIWSQAARLGDEKPRGRMQCSTPDEFCTYIIEAGFDIESVDHDERLVRVFCTKKSESASPVDDDGVPPFGYLDSPALGAAVQGEIEIFGFCMDNVTTIDVLIDGRTVGRPERNGPYPGIDHLFPRYLNELPNCRFSLPLDTRTLADGPHEISVVATDKNNCTARITGEYFWFNVHNS